MAIRKSRRWLHAMVAGGANLPNLATATLRWAVVDSAIVPADSTITGDEYLSDIQAGVIGTSDAIGNQSVVDALLDGDDVALPDDGGGETGEYMWLYADTGNAATSRLILLSDDAANLPITQDGVADQIQHNASGILSIG
jgi:hypothetical protein